MLTTPLTVTPSAQAALDHHLRTSVWRADQLAVSRAPTMSTGHSVLDSELPNDGWPRSALVELLVQQHGIGEMQLLKPALAALSRQQRVAFNRRQAMWQAKTAVPAKGLLRPAEIVEELVELESPTAAENVTADYRYLGLTLGRHPLSFLRERLTKMRFVPSDVLANFSNGQLARGCGIVTVRQRPSTANGVVFVTLEDESGTVNVICWPTLVAQFRREVMSAQLLGVYGIWQCESNVRHLVAKRLVDLSHLLGELDTRSRDFH